jgi:hypothetical protein
MSYDNAFHSFAIIIIVVVVLVACEAGRNDNNAFLMSSSQPDVSG